MGWFLLIFGLPLLMIWLTWLMVKWAAVSVILLIKGVAWLVSPTRRKNRRTQKLLAADRARLAKSSPRYSLGEQRPGAGVITHRPS